MRLTQVGDRCDDGRRCPTVFQTDRGTVVVQGWELTDPEALAQLGLPAGESAVEIPAELVAVLRHVE